jgi:hypothetical protein
MKAIRIEEYGGPETLRLRNLELPDPEGHRDVKAMIEQTLATFGDNIFGTSYSGRACRPAAAYSAPQSTRAKITAS